MRFWREIANNAVGAFEKIQLPKGLAAKGFGVFMRFPLRRPILARRIDKRSVMGLQRACDPAAPVAIKKSFRNLTPTERQAVGARPWEGGLALGTSTYDELARTRARIKRR